jgi:hypothetical protein
MKVLCFFQAESVSSGGSDLDKTSGNLLYTIATKLKTQISHHRRLLAEYVGRKKITSEQQLTGKCLLSCYDFSFLVAVSLFTASVLTGE